MGGHGTATRFDSAVDTQGYRWWYADGLSDDGRYGFTVIAFVGSVFSPYYAWSGRQNPENHCAINMCLYGPGVKRWTMTERGKAALARTSTRFQVGPSSLEWTGDSLIIKVDEISCPLPRRVRGRIRLNAFTRNSQSFALDPAERHLWHPIAPAARVDVQINDPALSWKGHGYVDSNWGSEPLEAGFSRWDWLRAPTPQGPAILYDATYRNGADIQLAMRFDEDGTPQRFAMPQRQDLPRGLWRVPRSVQCDPGCTPEVAATLEDTPFYMRSLIDCQIGGDRVTAFHESLSLDRFATQWVKVLLPFRMPRRV